MSEKKVYVERMNGSEFTTSFPNECFRLATPLEIKLYAVKEIFS